MSGRRNGILMSGWALLGFGGRPLPRKAYNANGLKADVMWRKARRCPDVLRQQVLTSQAWQEMEGGAKLADAAFLDKLVYRWRTWCWFERHGRHIKARLASLE